MYLLSLITLVLSPLPLVNGISEAGSFDISLVKRTAVIPRSTYEVGVSLVASLANTAAKYGQNPPAQPKLSGRGLALYNQREQEGFKFHRRTGSTRRKKRSEPKGFVQLGDEPGDTAYYAAVAIGTPPVSFLLQLDTGSSDLIIAAAPCYKGCDVNSILYNPNNSTSSVVSNKLFNIVGKASGNITSDTVTFAGFTQNQTFGPATSSENIARDSISGLFGLAWSGLSEFFFFFYLFRLVHSFTLYQLYILLFLTILLDATGSVPFLQGLWQNGLLSEPLFAFAFARWGNTYGGYAPGGM